MSQASNMYLNPSSWLGKSPGFDEPFVHDVSEKRRNFIQTCFAQLNCGEVENVKALRDYDGDAGLQGVLKPFEGRYKVENREGKKFVCHAKRFISPQSYCLADAIYGQVAQHGISTPRIIYPNLSGENSPIQKVEGLDVAFTTYVPGVPVNPNHEGHMGIAAGGIARLKDALCALPANLTSKVMENGQSVLERWQAGRDLILSDAGRTIVLNKFGETAPDILRLVEIFKENTLGVELVPTHSDFVAGNYYIDSNRNPLMLDFDNIGASPFPQDVDIGVMTHRIGLEQLENRDIQSERKLIRDVIGGYNAEDFSVSMTEERLGKALVLGICWKLCVSFEEYTQNSEAQAGLNKVETFGRKALDVMDVINRHELIPA
jgi:Ser/Thr protein kinase RdoA (MazF antagonist)